MPIIPDSPRDLSPELEELAAVVTRSGHTPAQVAAWVAEVSEFPASTAPLVRLKARTGDLGAQGRFERLALHWAAEGAVALLAGAPVPPKVKELWQQEREWMTRSASGNTILLDSPGFEAAAKIATLRRFPAGPMDWEISGIPRSWMLKTQHKGDALRLAVFIARRLGGIQPLFFLHMGRKPRNRALILEAEVMRMFHRAARAVQLQPAIRGLMAYGWFHDPQAVAANPHLEWLNRPYLEAGGIRINLAAADLASGVAEGNAARRKSLADGTLAYRLGLAVWPRAAMLRWAAEHPEWAD